MSEILDGNRFAEEMQNDLHYQVQELFKRGVIPGLAAVLVGEDLASGIYVRAKERACQKAGIFSETFHLSSSISEEELLNQIRRLNEDPRFHGILIQLPLPSHIDEVTVICAVSPAKDVDGFHPVNVGRLAIGSPLFIPCTPAGILEMIARMNYPVDGKHTVICGRSNIVGKPMAMSFMQHSRGLNASVTVCQSVDWDIGDLTRQADILIVAVGKAGLITAEMVKDGAVVFDVGINHVPDPTKPRGYRLVGDVDFESVKGKVGAITPVPGGVGPMTITMLMANTLKAAKISAGA